MNKYPYTSFEKGDFAYANCGVCGTELKDFMPKTVIPENVLKEYEAEKIKLSLSCNMSVEAQNLAFPICKTCYDGGFHLLIKKFSDLCVAGFTGISWMKEQEMINYFGLLYNSFAYLEYYNIRKGVESKFDFLTDDGFINRMAISQMMLNKTINKLETNNFEPSSLLFFKMHEYKGNQGFDFRISLESFTLMLRFKDVGFIFSMLDNGTNKKYFTDYTDVFKNQTLHPIQLLELYTQVSYKNYLLNKVFEYGFADFENKFIMEIRIPENLLEVPMYAEWNDKEFSQLLINNLKGYGFKDEEIYDSNEGLSTFLMDQNGKAVHLSENGSVINTAE